FLSGFYRKCPESTFRLRANRTSASGSQHHFIPRQCLYSWHHDFNYFTDSWFDLASIGHGAGTSIQLDAIPVGDRYYFIKPVCVESGGLWSAGSDAAQVA